MNTTKKGDAFEARIFQLFREEIEQRQLFGGADLCKIYAKKAYHSKDRDGDIIFDIAIEVFMLGGDSPSLIILIECKNYNHPVPVDDVEEFYQKIQQISGSKGIIASTCSFQRAALNFATSKRLGILRYYDHGDHEWILRRSSSSISPLGSADRIEVRNGLLSESHKSQYFDCYCYTYGYFTNSLYNLLRHVSEIASWEDQPSVEIGNADKASWVKYISSAVIDRISCGLRSRINYTSGSVSLLDICEWRESTGELIVEFDNNSEDVISEDTLGFIRFNPDQISIINVYNDQNPRHRFTLAHELGHHFLGHSKYMTSERINLDDVEDPLPSVVNIGEIRRLEWQANYFASSLLLPRKELAIDLFVLLTQLGVKYRGHGMLYLDHQSCNIDTFYKVSGLLTRKYNVSRTALKIRLLHLGLLEESGSGLQRVPALERKLINPE